MNTRPRKNPERIKAAVVGASGYAGMELAHILSKHPQVELLRLFSSPRDAAGRPSIVSGHAAKTAESASWSPVGSERTLSPFEEREFLDMDCDVVFFATPNEISHTIIPRYQTRSFKMIDLSGSFRLKQASEYPRWYQFEHAAPQLLSKFVYGLPELHKKQIQTARWIANPGCYATSALLPLLPLVKADWVDETAPLVCDSKSGVSGAGKQPTENTHFCEVAESFKAYSVFSHRHLPEIEQALGLNGNHKVIFTPHLLPINRGILSTLYLKLKKELSEDAVRKRLTEFYIDAPFVRIFPRGELPQVKYVAHTNFCDIGVRVEKNSPWVILISCLDNLVKGAAGQAVQNMNLMLGLNERLGLA